MKSLIQIVLKKNILLSIFIAQCSLAIPLKAMEESAELQSIELRNLPPEILFKVALNLVPKKITDSLQIIKIFESLTRLMVTNSQFYEIVQDKLFLKTLEKKLIKRITSLSTIESAKIRLEALGANTSFIELIDRVEKELIAREAIKNAVLQNDIETVKKLLPTLRKRNFNITSFISSANEEGQPSEQISIEFPALTHAIETGNLELVELLLDHGANSNIQFTYPVVNNTIYPLGAAATTPENTRAIIELLLKNGANIEDRDESNQTPLILAAAVGNSNAVDILVERGANIEARDSEGFTPLLTVLLLRVEDWLQKMLILLKNNANINAQSNTGKTALMLAVKKNIPQLVALLMRYGADVNIKDNNGRTALSLAEQKNLPDIINLLKKAQKK